MTTSRSRCIPVMRRSSYNFARSRAAPSFMLLVWLHVPIAWIRPITSSGVLSACKQIRTRSLPFGTVGCTTGLVKYPLDRKKSAKLCGWGVIKGVIQVGCGILFVGESSASRETKDGGICASSSHCETCRRNSWHRSFKACRRCDKQYKQLHYQQRMDEMTHFVTFLATQYLESALNRQHVVH